MKSANIVYYTSLELNLNIEIPLKGLILFLIVFFRITSSSSSDFINKPSSYICFKTSEIDEPSEDDAEELHDMLVTFGVSERCGFR